MTKAATTPTPTTNALSPSGSVNDKFVQSTGKSKAISDISLSLRDHHIAFTLPFGSKMDGRLMLPCGALIFGDFSGDIFCESGSVIIKHGARFTGVLEADNIYIEGEVAPLDEENHSILIGRNLVAGFANARISANIFSPAFDLHKAKIWGQLRTLEEAASIRNTNRAQPKPSAAKPT